MSTATLPVPVKWTKEQQRNLVGTLATVFCGQFEKLVSEHLDIVENGERLDCLERVIGKCDALPADEVARLLVKKVRSHDKVRELVIGMVRLRPTDWSVQELAVEHDVSMPDLSVIPRASPSKDRSILHDRVIQFNVRFDVGKKWWGHLHAYKQMHESVHGLEVRLDAIRDAIDAARRQPSKRQPLQRITIQLRPLVKRARNGANGAEFPENQISWVNDFENAVNKLEQYGGGADTGATQAAWETQLALPNRQGEMNRELVNCAKRLQPESLIPMIDEILPELDGDSDQAEREMLLRKELDQFRSLCSGLESLHRDHDICQRIQTALAGIRNAADNSVRGRRRTLRQR